VLAALAPGGNDARECVAIGPAGEVYEPDGHGAWIRTRAIEIALPESAATGAATPGAATSRAAIPGPVAGAARAGAHVLVLTHDGPPFRLARDGWTVVHFGMHAKPIVSAGPRPIAAIGRTLFALDNGREPVKLLDAPMPILAAAASAGGVVIETDAGLARLDGKRWKPITGAPHHVAALLSDRFALEGRGAIDLRSQKTIDWPAGTKVDAAIATEDSVIAVAQHGKDLELLTWRPPASARSHADAQLATEPVVVGADAPAAHVDAAAAPVGVTTDRAGRVVVALRDGRLVVRDKGPHGTWSTVRVQDALPAARPGPAPATQK